MSKRRNGLRTCIISVAVVVLAIVLPLLLDMGAYYIGIDEEYAEYYSPSLLVSPPKYHFGGQVAESFFYPAHYVDRRFVRSDAWIDEQNGHPKRFKPPHERDVLWE